jgi:ADP-ribose pyrophosphatase YjhB (NUDIX family)
MSLKEDSKLLAESVTKVYKNPSLTVDAIVIREVSGLGVPEILLIERENAPYGWALPGGFVDYGESTENAVARELLEETNLVALSTELVCVASDPDRDPRQHVVSVVYLVDAEGIPVAADDAKEFGWFKLDNLPELAFDHKEIIENNMGEFAGM